MYKRNVQLPGNATLDIIVNFTVCVGVNYLRGMDCSGVEVDRGDRG